MEDGIRNDKTSAAECGAGFLLGLNWRCLVSLSHKKPKV